MTAELLKVRLLPTPRMLLALTWAAVAAAALVVYLVEPSDRDWYHNAPLTTASLAVQIAAIVFGVWVATVEFAQGTLRRTLTAEPRRTRVVAAKLATVALVASVGALVTAVGAFWLGALAADLNGTDYDADAAWKLGAAAVIGGLFAAMLSFALALLVQSLTGGMVLSFAVLFVIDGALNFVGPLRDYTFNAALRSVTDALDPDATSVLGVWGGIGVALAWIAALLVPATVRFARADLK